VQVLSPLGNLSDVLAKPLSPEYRGEGSFRNRLSDVVTAEFRSAEGGDIQEASAVARAFSRPGSSVDVS
jgi:hypothetical protein